MTWAQLTAVEPQLANLLSEAQAMRRQGKGSVDTWHAQFKPRLARLVGWDRASHPLLGTMAAYDLAYDKVYRALVGRWP